MAAAQELPQTHRALILTSTTAPPEIKTIPTPHAVPGSVVVRMQVCNVVSYASKIYNGTLNFPLLIPSVIGSSGIGRIVTVGPDATSLKPGQLVLVDSFIRARDNPSVAFLLGIHEGFSDGSRVLARGEWRDATYAEYAKLPLENCYPLDESKLLSHGLGYTIEELADISRLAVPYGGLADIDIKAGETVIVAPATGPFGGAAVRVALAMGARVIAMGRNAEVLKRIKENNERVEVVPITGDAEGDLKALKQFGPIDAYFDISPPAAAESTHLRSAMLALEHGGRVSLMGGIRSDISIPHALVVHQELQLKGKWMYSREQMRGLIKMVEGGILKIGSGSGRIVQKFALEDWHKAFEAAEGTLGTEKLAIILP
ncbi:Uncharacterized protein BP5553_04069 [Venustampulla echinocandica]|uniref:GroES-like protein n=1 Tax=Venustampulla echinocandica TaxID=2656787 RepID=A0A370TW37_9HELO|nr:Uncharacterized protein BP5553_04069 [Venustampulla echinocandica]RDL39729.1 Uncharacterized protein BP5553_04069 [Venustampulla echinocandica]